MEDTKYPIGGFAPGHYMCRCVDCKESFMGDKRAVQCEPCAIKSLEKYLSEETVEEASERASKSKSFVFTDKFQDWESYYNKMGNFLYKEGFKAGVEWQTKKIEIK